MKLGHEQTEAAMATDTCPLHGGTETNEYDFGMQDATIIKFSCGCCAVLDDWGDCVGMFTSYGEAESTARYMVAKGSVDNAAFA